MAEKQKKEGKTGLFALASTIIVAVILVVIAAATFVSKYTGFNSDEVALAYVDTIVQSGDGYNAYKNTILSKNYKFGDFIRENYMNQYVNDDIDDVELDSETEAEYLDKLYGEMYNYYVELIDTYGYDNYDMIFSKYFEKMVPLRKEIFKSEYMDTEIMFSAFESNVASYKDSLTGTEVTYDENTKVKLTDKTIGKYEELFGEDYKLTCKISDMKALSDSETEQYKKNMPSDILETYKMTADDINAVNHYIITISEQNSGDIETQEIYTVKIGKTWYVDNTSIDTTALYKIA